MLINLMSEWFFPINNKSVSFVHRKQSMIIFASLIHIYDVYIPTPIFVSFYLLVVKRKGKVGWVRIGQ